MMHLQGKSVVLCVTGGIAAYKAADLTSRLKKKGAEVFIVMTKSATEFITPLTLMQKDDLADLVLDRLLAISRKKEG